MKRLSILVLSCFLCSSLSAQIDTLHLWQRDKKFIDRMVSSQAFHMTYIGVPLVVGGLLIKSEDDHFHSLRNDYLPQFNHHADDYLQYFPAAVMLGMKAGGVEGPVRGDECWHRMLSRPC